MSDLKTIRTVHNIRCGKHDWVVGGPLTKYAPQLLTIHGTGGGVSIDATDIDLLIEALTTVRDGMKEAQA